MTWSKAAMVVAVATTIAALLAGTGMSEDAGSVSADVKTSATRADSGASIDVSSIAVVDVLSPGRVYRLPAFGIHNPNGGRATFRPGVAFVAGQDRRPAPAEWFRFTPDSVVLDAGRTRAVSARIELPPDAGEGDYATLLGAWLVPSPDGGRAGAAAGAHVTFAIQEPGSLELWRHRLDSLWIWLVLASVLGMAWMRRYSM